MQSKFISRIDAVPAAAWNQLNPSGNPFVSFEFLAALEASGCVVAERGWQPNHLLLQTGDQQLLAALPCYIKHHSYGEYVFDWSWAQAYERHGQRYYPKLLAAVPFTPSQGPRLLYDPAQLRTLGLHPEALGRQAAEALTGFCANHGLSSWHLLFPDPHTRRSLTQPGIHTRSGCQYHWFNHGYADFDAFLASLTSRRRKTLRKERRQVAEQGLGFEMLSGATISDRALSTFFRFYQSTYHRHGQREYLNLDFFQTLRARLPNNLLLLMARREGAYLAGALFLRDATTLYGRYWGCAEQYDQLHFEMCYYRGIDYCIEQGLVRFDAGAQGEHKLIRGFEPVATWSLHHIQQPDFDRAIAAFIADETRAVAHYQELARAQLPFRRKG